MGKDNHCVLGAWKSFKVNTRRQTYVLKTKIAQGTHIWVQNNQLSTLPSTNVFKRLFTMPKISSFCSFKCFYEIFRQFLNNKINTLCVWRYFATSIVQDLDFLLTREMLKKRQILKPFFSHFALWMINGLGQIDTCVVTD